MDVVTEKGFFFENNTFIYGQNIKTYNTATFLLQQSAGQTEIKDKGKLKEDIFNALRECLKNSDAVRKKFKKYL